MSLPRSCIESPFQETTNQQSRFLFRLPADNERGRVPLPNCYPDISARRRSLWSACALSPLFSRAERDAPEGIMAVETYATARASEGQHVAE
jgi:hypothetical protein